MCTDTSRVDFQLFSDYFRAPPADPSEGYYLHLDGAFDLVDVCVEAALVDLEG
jgi:hypothetical protein